MLSIRKNFIELKIYTLLLFIYFLIVVLFLFKVFNLAKVGLDLTDEGYYFNWISNPWLYKYYVSQFGYIYHPIYKALGNSIIHLRQANMIISFGLSWLLSYFVLQQTLENTSKKILIIASASLALPALYILMITGYWVPSPSYNSLNFQGCLLAAMGFVFALKPSSKFQFFSILLIGIGGWLVFMAKPSTALLLFVSTVVYFLPSIKKDWLILLGAGFTALALLGASAFFIDGSILQLIKRYQGGLILLSNMASGHELNSLIKLDLFSLSILFKLKFLLLTALIYFGFNVANSNKLGIKVALALILLLILFYVFFDFINPNNQVKNIKRYHTLLITTLTFASFIYFAINKGLANQLITNKLILLFLVLPYLFAAGTGNNYWQTAAGASVFWVLAAVMILAKVKLTLPLLNLTVCFVTSMCIHNLFDSMNAPYRQKDPLFKQNATYVDRRTQQIFVLSDDTAKYLNTLKKILLDTGFKPQTPVIDLTGHHPGALYFMQAKAIGQAWTIGGYPGSLPLAEMALNQASCEDVANAWLLVEKDGRRQISHTILEKHGIRADKSTYTKLAKFNSQSVDDFGGVNLLHPDAIYEHVLLKPVDAENQTKACLAFRKTHPSPFY